MLYKLVMDCVYTFNTVGRQPYGRFYLDFIKAVDPEFFNDSDNPFIMAMVGSRGKSLAADVTFHHVFNHLDPIDIIEGDECRHMYLEDKPKDAIYRPLFDHGKMTLEDGSDVGVSAMFVNQPIPEILGCQSSLRPIDDGGLHTAQCLKDVFEQKRQGSVGGLIFASGFATYDHSHVTLYMEGGTHKNWEAEHTVFVNSQALQESEYFQERWEALKTKYESHSVCERRP